MKNAPPGPTVSLWKATVAVPSPEPMREDARADVVIVGAGIAGLTAAYYLSLAKKSVIVLDDGPVGGGETERTSAHLSYALDHRYHEIVRMHGAERAQIAAQSHVAAIRAIELNIEKEGIDCDFARLDGWLYAGKGESPDEIEKELAACQRLGLAEVERRDRVPGLELETGACLRFPGQARFNPLGYLRGLLGAAQRNGVRVFTGTHVDKIQGGKNAHVQTSAGHTVTSTAVIVATNTPVNDMIAIHTKQAAYRSYVVAMEIDKDSAPDVLLWDTLDPFHYVRVAKGSPGDGHDLLIVGGEDHKTGQDNGELDRHERLEEWARARFAVRRTAYRWSGQIMESTDGLAFIGRNPGDDSVFIATGDSGNGLTHGTIAGRLLSDLIEGVDNPWEKVYDPSRLPGGKEFVKESANMVAQFAEWLKPGDVPHAADVQPGDGAVVRRGLSFVAVHCDADGRRTECSAVCPHLGAIVRWNAVEKTWDCPAHGSRFTPEGQPVNGPAISGLKPATPE